jgi:para-aminobenzoate synthetase component 1
MQINSFDTHCPAPALFEKYFSQRPHCFFLDSGMDPQKLGRFSFMGAEPFLVLKTKGRLIEVSEYQGVKVSKTKRFIGDPFAVLKELLRKYKNDFYSDDVPFLGGAVGYFSYDLCHFIEKLPSTAIDDIGAPDLYLGFYDKIVAVDHMKNKTYVI